MIDWEYLLAWIVIELGIIAGVLICIALKL